MHKKNTADLHMGTMYIHNIGVSSTAITCLLITFTQITTYNYQTIVDMHLEFSLACIYKPIFCFLQVWFFSILVGCSCAI